MQQGNKHTHWLASWLLAVVVFGLALAGWEYQWRSTGYLPSVSDDKALWASQREQATETCNTVALLGASRLNLNIDTQTLREQWPGRHVVQLGVNGHYPLATLEDLARDGFCGVALVSVIAQAFETERSWEMQQPWVDFFHSWTLNQRIDRWLQARLESVFHFLPEDRSVWPTLDALWKHGHWPDPPYYRMLPDRSMQADFGQTDSVALANHFVIDKEKDYQAFPPSSPAQWQKEAGNLRSSIRQIKERGGQVVFLRFPTSGGHWELDQQYYPKQSYWDVLSDATGALTLHFQEVPGWEDIELPDTSHLDYRDAPAFTLSLVEVLRSQGVIGED